MIPFNASHVQFLTPLVVEDDQSFFVHMVLANADGINVSSAKAIQGQVGEYHAKNGDIYPVTNHMFGYIMEVPKNREATTLFQLIDEEVGLVQGFLDEDQVFNDVVKAKEVPMASIINDPEAMASVAEGERPVVGLVWVSPLQFADPKTIHLNNNDIVPLYPIGDGKVTHGYVVELYEGDSEAFISEQFPHLSKHMIHVGEADADTVQPIWLDDSITDAMIHIN